MKRIGYGTGVCSGLRSNSHYIVIHLPGKVASLQSTHGVICAAHGKSGQMFGKHVENAKHRMAV